MSWKTVALGDVCEMYQPKTITSKDLVVDGEYFVYGANGIIGKYSSFNHEQAQLVIGCRGSVGSVHMTKPKSWITGNAMVVNPKVNYINLRFLEYFFRGAVDLSKAITGAAQPQITRTSLSPINFSYPSILVQQNIVAKLDVIFAEIDKATAAAEANVKNSEALFQSYLSKVLKADTENINPEKEPSRVFQYVDVSSVSKEILKITEPQEILGKDAPSRARKLIKKDDVLFATVRPTLRRIALVPEELDGEVCSTGYFVLRSNGKLLQKFIFYSLLRNEFMEVMEKIQTGASYPAVNDKQVLEQIISFPPLNIQKLIVTKLDSISEELKKSAKSYTDKVSECTTLKQSILKQAFNGELVKE